MSASSFDACTKVLNPCPMTAEKFHKIIEEIEGPQERRNKRAGPKEVSTVHASKTSSVDDRRPICPKITACKARRIVRDMDHAFLLWEALEQESSSAQT